MSPPSESPAAGITALIPCFNEVECIDRAYAEIRAELDRYPNSEILFVDDGSTDGTLERIRAFAAADPTVHYLSFTRNFGQESAFSAGFRYAAHPWTVQLDADLQSPPAAMHQLIQTATTGYDVVFGVRDGRRDGWLRRLGGTGHQMIARRLLGIEIPPGASAFRVVRTSVARKIVELRLGTPYFLATVPLLGARYTTVPTPHQPRQGGRGKWKLSTLVRHAVDLFTGFSFRPLAANYLIALLGALGCLIALALAGMGVTGAPAVAAAVLSAGALLCVALLARYLVRVIRGQPGLPRYQIREANLTLLPGDDLYEYERPPAGGRIGSPTDDDRPSAHVADRPGGHTGDRSATRIAKAA